MKRKKKTGEGRRHVRQGKCDQRSDLGIGPHDDWSPRGVPGGLGVPGQIQVSCSNNVHR